MKLAVIEGMWETEPAPAGFNLFGIPDTQSREVKYAVKIPWMLGIIATRSFNQPIPGINDLVAHAEERIRNGLIAYRRRLRKSGRTVATAKRRRSSASTRPTLVTRSS